MSKKLILFLTVVLAFASLASYRLYQRSFSFRIYSQTDRLLKKGFRNCDMNKNGEGLFLKNCLAPGDVVFDIGANKGEWSLRAMQAEPSLHVFAFEPVDAIHSILKQNLQEYYPNVKTFPLAMDQEVGSLSFFYYPSTSEFSGFYDRDILKENLTSQKITVPTVSLDHFSAKENISHIDLVKIDTEGAEWRVLQGAQELIRNEQIEMIQFEYGGTYIDANITLNQIARFFSDHNYLLFRIIPKGLLHIEKWQPSMENYRYSNFLAVRQKKWPQFKLTVFPEEKDKA